MVVVLPKASMIDVTRLSGSYPICTVVVASLMLVTFPAASRVRMRDRPTPSTALVKLPVVGS